MLPLQVMVSPSYHVRSPHFPGSHLAAPLTTHSRQLGEHSAINRCALVVVSEVEYSKDKYNLSLIDPRDKIVL